MLDAAIVCLWKFYTEKRTRLLGMLRRCWHVTVLSRWDMELWDQPGCAGSECWDVIRAPARCDIAQGNL